MAERSCAPGPPVAVLDAPEPVPFDADVGAQLRRRSRHQDDPFAVEEPPPLRVDAADLGVDGGQTGPGLGLGGR